MQLSTRVATALIAGVAILSSILIAQTRPPSAADAGAPSTAKPDLSGIWMIDGRVDPATGVNRRRFLRGEPPRLPWAEEQYQAARKGVPDPNEQGRDDLDPLDNCFPPSPARLANLPRPFELIQFPNRVLMLSEWDHWVRWIWMDGRGHQDSFLTSFMGHSIGKWEGDTLVVDTADLLGNNWIDGVGNPQTDAMHIVERFRRTDHDTLEIDYLFEDPKAYTKPWGGKKVYELNPVGLLEHVVCQDFLQIGKKR